MKIVVNTPAGNIGRVVANKLLDMGHGLTIVSRHPENCADLVGRRARLIEGSIDDPAALDRAFAGADALFWVTPFAFDRPEYVSWARGLARTAADAARRSGIRRVVLISSIGAQHDAGTGPIVCCKPMETAFAQAVPDVCSLRAASFMENFLAHLPTIATQGVIYSPHPSDRLLPMVATRDVAAKAIEALLDSRWTGFRIAGVHGPEDIDHATAARIISGAIGKPVRHVETSPEEACTAMLGQGLPPFVARLLADMYRGFREGRVAPAEPRTVETTTPTTLQQFSEEVLRPALRRFEATLARDSVALA